MAGRYKINNMSFL